MPDPQISNPQWLPGKISVVFFDEKLDIATLKNPRMALFDLQNAQVGEAVPITEQKQEVSFNDLPLKGSDYRVRLLQDGPDGEEPLALGEAQFKTLDGLELHNEIRRVAGSPEAYAAVLTAAGIDPDIYRAQQVLLYNVAQDLLAKQYDALAAQARKAITDKGLSEALANNVVRR